MGSAWTKLFKKGATAQQEADKNQNDNTREFSLMVLGGILLGRFS